MSIAAEIGIKSKIVDAVCEVEMIGVELEQNQKRYRDRFRDRNQNQKHAKRKCNSARRRSAVPRYGQSGPVIPDGRTRKPGLAHRPLCLKPAAGGPWIYCDVTAKLV